MTQTAYPQNSLAKTSPEDWTVEIVRRVQAAGRAEYLAFKFSYQGGEEEILEDVPFEKGYQEEHLKLWLANRDDEVNLPKGKMGRTLSDTERQFIGYLTRKYPLYIYTRVEGSFIVAEIPELGVSARARTYEGAKRNAVGDALCVFKRMDKVIVEDQSKSLGDDEGVNIWAESLQRMHVIKGLLSEHLDKPARKKLVRGRRRRPMRTKIVHVGLRSASARFQDLCMGRPPVPF